MLAYFSRGTRDRCPYGREEIHSQLNKVYEFLVSVGSPVQGVMYDNSSTLWHYLECNPVTSVKQKKVNVRFVGIDIGVMVNQIIGIRLTGHGMAQI